MSYVFEYGKFTKFDAYKANMNFMVFYFHILKKYIIYNKLFHQNK